MESPLAEPSYLSAPQCLVHPSAHIQDGQILLRSGHFWDLPGWYGDINKSTSKSNTTHTHTQRQKFQRLPQRKLGGSRNRCRQQGCELGSKEALGKSKSSAGLSKDSSCSSWNWLQAEKAFCSIIHQEIELFSGGNLDLQVKGENKTYAWHEESQATFKEIMLTPGLATDWQTKATSN